MAGSGGMVSMIQLSSDISSLPNPDRVQSRMADMTARLKRKGYPSNLIKGAINKALSIDRRDILFPTRNDSPTDCTNQPNPIYCVTTFNDNMVSIAPQLKTIVECHNLLNPDRSPLSIQSSYRKSPSLKDSLMFRKDRSLFRVRKCLKNCLLCREYLLEGNSVKLKNGSTIKINANFECTSRNLIYIAICSGCNEYYIGETGDKLCNRFANHRSQGKIGATITPVLADIHFRTCGKDKYKVFPFYRPRFNDILLRREYEELFIRRFKPKLNGLKA